MLRFPSYTPLMILSVTPRISVTFFMTKVNVINVHFQPTPVSFVPYFKLNVSFCFPNQCSHSHSISLSSLKPQTSILSLTSPSRLPLYSSCPVGCPLTGLLTQPPGGLPAFTFPPTFPALCVLFSAPWAEGCVFVCFK